MPAIAAGALAQSETSLLVSEVERDHGVGDVAEEGARPAIEDFEAITLSVLIEADAAAEALHALVKHATL